MKIEIPKSYIEEGLISVKKHPEYSIFLYNATEKCYKEHKWDSITMKCRGLILNHNNVIVARPFEKFWNYKDFDIGPQAMRNNESVEIYEKFQGIYLIGFYAPSGEYQLTEQNDFFTDSSYIANTFFKEYYSEFCFDEDYTFMFEMVNIQGTLNLMLLGAINKETGEDASIETLMEYSFLMHIPLPSYTQFNSFNEFMEFSFINNIKTPAVIKFKSGKRMVI